MKKYILAAILAAIVYAAPAMLAQDQIPEVSQTKITVMAKPFVGNWAAVSCESSPLGIRFSIRVDSIPDQDNGTRLAPVFKLTGIQGAPMKKGPFDFQTNAFLQPHDAAVLQVENANLIVTLAPTQVQGKVMTSLTGIVQKFLTGSKFDFFVIPDQFKADDYSYVTPLAIMCPKSNVPDDEPQARLMKASFTIGAPVAIGNDATSEEIDAASQELDQFAQNYPDVDWASFGREKVGQPWFARFSHFTDNGGIINWNNEGYPKPLMAVKALEHNFLTNPKGKDETFQEEPSAQLNGALFQHAVFMYVDESPEQQQAALNELNSFAADHALIGAYRDGTKEGTYDVALFFTDDDGNATGDGPKWVVYGAATLTEGVKQIESDYTTYPNGHDEEGGKA